MPRGACSDSAKRSSENPNSPEIRIMKTRAFPIFTVLAFGGLAASSASAATRTWTGDGSTGQWNIDSWANWRCPSVRVRGRHCLRHHEHQRLDPHVPRGRQNHQVPHFPVRFPGLRHQAVNPLRLAHLPIEISHSTMPTPASPSRRATLRPTPSGLRPVGSVVLAGNLTATHNGSGTLTINRPITGVGFGLTKEGTGTMKLLGCQHLRRCHPSQRRDSDDWKPRRKRNDKWHHGRGFRHHRPRRGELSLYHSLHRRRRGDSVQPSLGRPCLDWQSCGLQPGRCLRRGRGHHGGGLFCRSRHGNALTATNRSLIKIGTGTLPTQPDQHLHGLPPLSRKARSVWVRV